MAWVEYNPNPRRNRVGDCAIRAIAKATDQDWEMAYTGLYVKGYSMGDLPSANSVWGAYLRDRGFKRAIVPNTCPDCFTVEDFCRENPRGMFVLALDGHVVTVVDGDYFDSWNSGNEPVLYYWYREEN